MNVWGPFLFKPTTTITVSHFYIFLNFCLICFKVHIFAYCQTCTPALSYLPPIPFYLLFTTSFFTYICFVLYCDPLDLTKAIWMTIALNYSFKRGGFSLVYNWRQLLPQLQNPSIAKLFIRIGYGPMNSSPIHGRTTLGPTLCRQPQWLSDHDYNDCVMPRR